MRAGSILGPPALCFASSEHTSAPEIVTLKLRSASAGISKTSPVDADRLSAEYAAKIPRNRGDFSGAVLQCAREVSAAADSVAERVIFELGVLF